MAAPPGALSVYTDDVEHDWFETGHMPYLHEESRVREAAGIAAFVRG